MAFFRQQTTTGKLRTGSAQRTYVGTASVVKRAVFIYIRQSGSTSLAAHYGAMWWYKYTDKPGPTIGDWGVGETVNGWS